MVQTVLILTRRCKPRRLIRIYTVCSCLSGQIVLLWTHITKTRLFKSIKISPPKTENFQIKSSDIFHISAQNIDCGYLLEPPRRGGSNGYPQSMFLIRNKKNNVYPCKPHFYYIKVGFKLYRYVFVMSII